MRATVGGCGAAALLLLFSLAAVLPLPLLVVWPVSWDLQHALSALGGPANLLAVKGSQEPASKDQPGLWR